MSSNDEDISRLYHEVDKPIPSQALDDAILNASRKATASPAHSGPFSGSWPAFASVAAVVVIAVILVPVLRQKEPPSEMEQISVESNVSADTAKQEQADLYRAEETRKRMMEKPLSATAPLAAPESPERDAAAARQALPETGLPGAAGLSTPIPGKSSISAERELPAGTDTDIKVRSRMEAADSAPFAVLTPEMWEVKITQLIDDGKIERATIELDKLKAHFPGYDIDRAIVEKLRKQHE